MYVCMYVCMHIYSIIYIFHNNFSRGKANAQIFKMLLRKKENNTVLS